MKRWVFNIAVGVSVLLSLATVAVCVRSYFRSDVFSRQTGDVVYALRSSRGRIIFRRATGMPPGVTAAQWRWIVVNPSDHLTQPGLLGSIGFGHHYYQDFFPCALPDGASRTMGIARIVNVTEWWLPYWSVSPIFLGYPSVSMLIYFRCRQQRQQRGLCLACGYDLRATAARCPECGEPVPPGHVPTVPPTNLDNNVV